MTDYLWMSNLKREGGAYVQVPIWVVGTCVNIKSGSCLNEERQHSPTDAFLHRYAGCIALKFFIVEVRYCARNLLENSVNVNICIVTIKALRQWY